MGRYRENIEAAHTSNGVGFLYCMPTPFDNLSLQDARNAISTPPYLEDNRLYFDGDHWGIGGKFWSGPRPDGASSAQVLAEIQRGFVSSNKVRETIERHVGGVVGREPAWGFTVNRPLATDEELTAAEQALIDEAEALLTSWWDERRIHALLRQATATLLWASRSCVRVFVPRGNLNNGSIIPFGTLPEDAINLLYVQRPDPTQATVSVDDDTQQRAGVYAYQRDNHDEVELSFVDSDVTVLRLLTADGITNEARLPIGGRLLLFEMTRDVLITPQVRQLQNLLNMALTMMQRNVILGGFLERVLLNVQLPGTFVDDPTQPSGKRFVPESFRVGAGTTNILQGTVHTNELGQSQVLNPSIIYRDPVPVDTFVATKEEACTAILEETQQLHAAIAGDATASGKSRQQAMADFLTSLLETAAEVNALGRWLLETVLSLTALFSGQPGRYDGLRATFDCRLDVGPLDPNDVQQVINLVNNKLLSHETGMARVRVDDVDAEQTRINAESDAAMQRTIQIAQATQPQPPAQGQPPANTQQPPASGSPVKNNGVTA
jgi:hypothetical protein